MGHHIQLIRRLLLLVTFVGPIGSAFAAELPKDFKQEIIADFTGGLDTNSKSHKIDKKYSKNMRNLLLDEKDGSLVKRNGFVQVGSTRTMGGITGMLTFNKENGDKEFIVTDSSVVMTTRDFQTFTLIASTLVTTNNLCMIQVRNKIWFSNGTDTVFTWDGTTKQKLDGNGGTPNVPTAKYLAFWQERVWAYNKPSDASALDFTSVITTDGVIIAPDDSRAWPAINELEIGRGDGSVGTALWIQQGQLQAGKTTSVWTIFGSNPSNYLPRKMLPDVGVISNDSVGLLDGNAYWLDQNGIYENGNRISDTIQPSVDAILKPTNRTLQNLWDTQADFNKGNPFAGSTVTADGFVTISSLDFTASQASATVIDDRKNGWLEFSSTVAPAGNGTDFAVVIPTPAIAPGQLFHLQKVVLWDRCPNGGCGVVTIHAKNTRTNTIMDKAVTVVSGGQTFAQETWDFNTGAGDVAWSDADLAGGKFFLQVTTGGGSPPINSWFQFFSPTTSGNATIYFTAASTFQYLSEVTTMTSVTAWGTFDAVRNTNGGSINFFYHTSTSAVNITTQTWQPIAPGAIIGGPTINNFVQWSATVTSISTNILTAANIDTVMIDHIEGSASRNRAFATVWKNRYWLSIATETSGNFSIQYVKAKKSNPIPNAWMQFQNMNIRSFTKDGSDTLYAGAASTGVFYRLDYGTNDNGLPIDALYDTPDFNLGDPFRNARLVELELDIDKASGGSLIIGVSKDFSTPYSTKAFSYDGTSGFANRPVIFDGIEGKVIAFRIQGNQLDVPLTINNIGVYYQPRFTR